jgi:hypothetical protein
MLNRATAIGFAPTDTAQSRRDLRVIGLDLLHDDQRQLVV